MKYLDYQNKLCFLFSTMLLLSCSDKLNCSLLAKLDSENECIIIVKKLPNSVFFDAEGINPTTKKECKCVDGGRWWIQYKKEIEIGDTIIKRKGELIFNIHKKNTVISHDWGECEGKIYNPDGTIKEVLKKK